MFQDASVLPIQGGTTAMIPAARVIPEAHLWTAALVGMAHRICPPVPEIVMKMLIVQRVWHAFSEMGWNLCQVAQACCLISNAFAHIGTNS